MIPSKIQALFAFIDFLDSNKSVYIEKYIPLCNELTELDSQRAKLKPDRNYVDKLQYDKVQKEISEKFKPIMDDIYIPVINKLKELEIWAGDDVFTSIWNNNISAISDLKRNFTPEEATIVIGYKEKYLKFRIETNSNFLSLQLVFQELDELLKQLFDFFKDTNDNEFDIFETKNIEVNGIEEAVENFIQAKGKNVRFSFPNGLGFLDNKPLVEPNLTTIKNEIIMGDRYQIGDITNNSGKIAIGKNIRISETIEGREETANKINELIELFKALPNISGEKRESLTETYGKLKDELSKNNPSKSKIFNWLVMIKAGLENLVLSHEVTEAVHWVYRNFNFIFQ